MALVLYSLSSAILWTLSSVFNRKASFHGIYHRWYRSAHVPQCIILIIILTTLAADFLTGSTILDFPDMVSSLFKNPSLASIIVFAGVGIGISFIGSLNLFSSINRENISHYVTSLTGLLFLTTTVLVIQREINIYVIAVSLLVLLAMMYTEVNPELFVVRKLVFTKTFIFPLAAAVTGWLAYLVSLAHLRRAFHVNYLSIFICTEIIASIMIITYCLYMCRKTGDKLVLHDRSPFITYSALAGIFYLSSYTLFIISFFEYFPIVTFVLVHGTRVVLISLYNQYSRHSGKPTAEFIVKNAVMIPGILIFIAVILYMDRLTYRNFTASTYVIITGLFGCMFLVQRFYYKVRFISQEAVFDLSSRMISIQKEFSDIYRLTVIKNLTSVESIQKPIIAKLHNELNLYFTGLFEYRKEKEVLNLLSFLPEKLSETAYPNLSIELDFANRLYVDTVLHGGRIDFLPEKQGLLSIPSGLESRPVIVMPVKRRYLVIMVESASPVPTGRGALEEMDISLERQVIYTEKLRILDLARKSYENLIDFIDALESTDTEQNRMKQINRAITHSVKNSLQIFVSTHHILSKKIANRDACASQLDAIKTRVDYLNKTVENIRNFLEVTPDRRNVDIAQIVNDLCNEFTQNMQPGGITLTCDVKCPSNTAFYLDATLIRRALDNIMRNAVISMPGGGTLGITLTCEKGSGKAVITVKDTGIGIHEKYLPHIFEPDVTMWNKDEVGVKGTGLGLAITKKILEKHGGTIEVASTPEKGTTFTITLKE